jgi:hypothetical protein
LLHRISEEGLTQSWQRSASAAQQIALQSLLKQGLVTADAAGRFRITSVVRSGFYPERTS